MRFMVLVKASKDSEAGVLPDEKLLTEMGSTTRSGRKPASSLPPRGSSQARRARGSSSLETSAP